MSRSHHRKTVGARIIEWTMGARPWLFASSGVGRTSHATKGTLDGIGKCACGKRVFDDMWSIGPRIGAGQTPTCRACAAILGREARP